MKATTMAAAAAKLIEAGTFATFFTLASAEPTYWPTYSPTTAAEGSSLRCPSSYDSYVQIDEVASLQYSIVSSDDIQESGIFCGRLLVKDPVGWVAIAFSEDGNMVGSDAIVANLDEQSVRKYHLGGKSQDTVTLMEDDKQTLLHTYVHNENIAIVEFAKLLVEENEVTINDEGFNIFLHARGDVWPGYHPSRTTFVGNVEKSRDGEVNA